MLLAALLPASAQAVPRTFYGLVPNELLSTPEFGLIRQANVGSARVLVDWARVEPSDDNFNWGLTDYTIGSLAAEGIQPFPNLFGTAPFVSGKSTKPPISKRAGKQWQEFLREAVGRYGRGGTFWRTTYRSEFRGQAGMSVRDWQVWNEENGPKHFSPRPDVGKYAKLLKLSKQAIQREDRGADIVIGGLAAKPTGEGGIDAWDYIAKLLKIKGAKQTFDHVALHPYAPNVKDVESSMKLIRKALKKGGKKSAETWVTEFGWSSDPNVGGKLAKTPEQQAKLLKQTYKLLKKNRKEWRVGGAYWYTWRDFQAGVCDWCPTAGLVDQNLNPKPAHAAYQQAAG